MDCLADTHASVWYLFAAPELPATAKNFMDATAASGGFIFVPTISVIEIIYLTEKGKLLPQTLPRLVQAINLPNSSFSFIELDSNIAQTLSQIPRSTVPDMPDRIIAATALHLNLPLVTKDRKIQALQSIQIVW